MLKDHSAKTVHIVEVPRYDLTLRLRKTLESDLASDSVELFDASGTFQESAAMGSSIHAILRV